MTRCNKPLCLAASGSLIACVALSVAAQLPGDVEAEKAWAAGIVGPLGDENSCSTCHALEVEAWEQTRHFATFKDRHRSDRAKEILKNMGFRSMKRNDACRACHYTSTLNGDKFKVQWGVSCESCHGPGSDWVDIHHRSGGDPAAGTIAYGTGKDDAADRETRRKAAQAKGMLHSEMIYEIATNCFGCHTVPNEDLVNIGKHKAGSDFDLVAWSQGEIRHNFVSSPGAPDNPTNRPTSPEQLRRLYIVGALVDLEFSLRNLAAVEQKGGDFHHAMIKRVNAARDKVDALLEAAHLADVAAAVNKVPANIDTSTEIDPGLADDIGMAAKGLGRAETLDAVDALIPTSHKGTAHKE